MKESQLRLYSVEPVLPAVWKKKLSEQLYPTGTFIKELRGHGYGYSYRSADRLTDQKNENFSQLARPLLENAYLPESDIPVDRIEGQLRDMLIGEGRLYQKGPTRLLIQKGRAGEFAYRAHKGRYREDMPRSHGMGHSQDTFGTGGENVIAAASSLAVAKAYRKEFIYGHGEEEGFVGIYMIDLEGLDI